MPERQPFGDLGENAGRDLVHDTFGFLHRSGLLWALNRMLLHPRGLALEVDVNGEAWLEGTSDPKGFEFDEESEKGGRRKFATAWGDEELVRLERALGIERRRR
jgi:hypothetical protein